MANGTEMEDFVLVSKVRAGHKREFAFAIKSQYEIAGSLGPSRTRKPLVGFDGVQDAQISRSMKKCRENGNLTVVEQKRIGETRSNVVMFESDVEADEESEEECMEKHIKGKRKQVKEGFTGRGRGGDGGAEVVIKLVPRKLKDLLQTGLLEGLTVTYRTRVQLKSPNSPGTVGVISGSRIRCFCKDCNGAHVVTPNLFELHAGSRNKRPADSIFFENGNSCRDVLNACIDSKIEDLEATIKRICGQRGAENTTSYGINCNGPISSGNGRMFLPNDVGMELDSSDKTPESENEDGIPERSNKASETSEEYPEAAYEASEETPETAFNDHEETLETTSKASYLPPGPVICKLTDDKSCKRLTLKHLGRHRMIFKNNNVLPDGTALFYYFDKKVWISGEKQGAGIFCLCCKTRVSPSQFEAHAGWGSHKQPYHHIFTSEGISLFMLSMSLFEKHKISTTENDELCNICQLEGDFIYCCGCPRVFHKECVHLQEIPDGNWYCRRCRYLRYKVVGNRVGAMAAGGVAGNELKENRCMRLVGTEESDRGGCVLCRAHDFVKGGFGPCTILLCDQCEREYHVGCLRDYAMQDLQELPSGKWFCRSECSKINYTLQQLIEDGGQQIPDSLLNIIKEKHASKDSKDVKLDVKWRLLSGKMAGVRHVEQLLSDAIFIFHEKFSPIVTPGSKTDFIPCMVYGKNLEDKDFQGMHCAVLTVNSQVVSAGLVRVYGTEIAEIPLVATAKYYEELGYFQALYTCIENLLGELKVKYLSVPATNEAKPLWTNKLGFSNFPKDELAQVLRWYQLMPFQDTTVLRKAVPRNKDHGAHRGKENGIPRNRDHGAHRGKENGFSRNKYDGAHRGRENGFRERDE